METYLVKISDFSAIDCSTFAHVFITSMEVLTQQENEIGAYDIVNERIILQKRIEQDSIILYKTTSILPPTVVGVFALSKEDSTKSHFVFNKKKI